jgi:RNA polymerase sigma factor (sigma-70 family)
MTKGTGMLGVWRADGKYELRDKRVAAKWGRDQSYAASFILDASTDSPIQTDAERLQKGYRYAVALTHHLEDAQDLVHEAWLNLSRRYGRVESNAVLCTAVRNLFIDQCRRKKIVQFESLDVPEAPDVPELAETQPGVQGDLSVLLGILRPVEREALFLHYYQGRTAEEIGQMMSRPRGTVLSLLHRAIAKLREAATQADGKTRCNQWLLLFVTYL